MCAIPCLCTISLIADLLAYIWILRMELWIYLPSIYVFHNPMHVFTCHTNPPSPPKKTILNSPGICCCCFYPILVAVILNTANLKHIKKNNNNFGHSCLQYCLCVDLLYYGLWCPAGTAVVKLEATVKALPETWHVILPAGDLSFMCHSCLVY